MGLPCAVCGTAFVPRDWRGKYCGEACYREAERIRHQRQNTGVGVGSPGVLRVPRQTCEVCGGHFYAPPHRILKQQGKFCSVRCRTLFRAQHREKYPQTVGRRGKGGKRADLGGLYLRSMWEANWARYLNFLVEHGEVAGWAYEPETFEFPVKRGVRFYTPDFKVTFTSGLVVFHEVKGWMDPRSATALRRMGRYHPKVTIVLVDQKVYSDMARSVGRMIPNWESARGNELARTDTIERRK